MDREIQPRLHWVKVYEQCGIDSLESQSKRPHSSPNSKITDDLRALTLEIREKLNLGARRLQTELIRLHQVHLSPATLHKVLSEIQVKPIITYRRKKDFQGYERPIPSDRYIVRMKGEY